LLYARSLTCARGESEGPRESLEIRATFQAINRLRIQEATGELLWQQSFYDHALRKDEDLMVVAAYIFTNPVKAGFVESAGDFRFSGGRYFETFTNAADGAKAASLRSEPLAEVTRATVDRLE
jgi:hypothetical protein